MKSIKLLVFDLDETLVHASTADLGRSADFIYESYQVYLRPHCIAMLANLSIDYELAIWSSASKDYVSSVVENLFADSINLKFVWHQSHCVQKVDLKSGGYVYLKDLRSLQKFGYQIEHDLMLDDSPEKLQRQPGRLLHVPAYLGDQADRYLLDLPGLINQYRSAN